MSAHFTKRISACREMTIAKSNQDEIGMKRRERTLIDLNNASVENAMSPTAMQRWYKRTEMAAATMFFPITRDMNRHLFGFRLRPIESYLEALLHSWTELSLLFAAFCSFSQSPRFDSQHNFDLHLQHPSLLSSHTQLYICESTKAFLLHNSEHNDQHEVTPRNTTYLSNRPAPRPSWSQPPSSWAQHEPEAVARKKAQRNASCPRRRLGRGHWHISCRSWGSSRFARERMRGLRKRLEPWLDFGIETC
ncbi:hypothetical protein K402DRAFT_267252 [Aulographum hederae CBS 113979]|uniref:Uncharacterized protein n=1 Tax=Aulographum hederae CBS 113979 TaxID=1176131 RepID=A0A6G1GIH6_9PEZI|nr:hypothetical protein K402DRAFT_267252 [Aulographum hederae CBS 113979]